MLEFEYNFITSNSYSSVYPKHLTWLDITVCCAAVPTCTDTCLENTACGFLSHWPATRTVIVLSVQFGVHTVHHAVVLHQWNETFFDNASEFSLNPILPVLKSVYMECSLYGDTRRQCDPTVSLTLTRLRCFETMWQSVTHVFQTINFSWIWHPMEVISCPIHNSDA